MSLTHRLLRTIALAAALPVTALAAPAQMPVSVTADSGRFEQDAGSGLYRGNVELLIKASAVSQYRGIAVARYHGTAISR